ncbi:unnamed protein product [Scytosiphon promiscuus]
MREDLPCEEPLPVLWSISLTEGGDVIDEGPHLDEFTVVEALELGEPRCRYWRVEEGDSEPHVLCETRFFLPERLAVPQLGRLRELMLREARLLDTLAHDCVVPLERAWLEQRTGLGVPDVGADASCCRRSLTRTGRSRASDADEPWMSKEDRATGRLECRCRDKSATAALNDGCVQLSSLERRAVAAAAAAAAPPPPLAPAPEASATGPIICCGGCQGMTQPVRFDAAGGDDSGSKDDPAAFLLRSWVPLTLEDVDGDDDHRNEGVEMTHSKEIASGSVRRSGPRYGGIPQLRWGGDDKTDWKGTAEPKPIANSARSITSAPASALVSRKQAPGRRAWKAGSTAGTGCGIHGRRCDTDGAGGIEGAPRQGDHTLCFAAYLLLPDWMPLSVWFETEFEPRVAAPDEQGGAANTGAVTNPDDWEIVWRHLTWMFSSVVRGVEHFHTKGFVHNSIYPCSVWVAPDGRCCLGNLSQITPPGCRRPPPQRDACAARHRHFASPERRRGGTVDSHSDVYALGVLLLEFWRNYALARKLGEISLAEDDDMVESFKSSAAETAQTERAVGLLDTNLVKSMLANDPFDRPDCFEVLDTLGEV